jgi:hypothetical protein
MIKGGYIIQPRIIQESDIYKSPPYVREIWAYLLREANSTDIKYGGFELKRGQLFTNYQKIRDDLSWFVGYRKMSYNENQTKKAMTALREAQRITTSKELGGVVITICNYDYYQNPKNYERTNDRTNESTTIEPMKNHPLPDNNKNVKNVKKERSNILLSQVDKSTLDETTFQYFEIAFSFWKLVSKNIADSGIKNTSVESAKFCTWVDPIRLLIENDKKTIEQIRKVYKFLNSDEFWGKQILSTAKLRNMTYFDDLLLKSNGENQRAYKKSVIPDNDEALNGIITRIEQTQL